MRIPHFIIGAALAACIIGCSITPSPPASHFVSDKSASSHNNGWSGLQSFPKPLPVPSLRLTCASLPMGEVGEEEETKPLQMRAKPHFPAAATFSNTKLLSPLFMAYGKLKKSINPTPVVPFFPLTIAV